MSPLDTNLVPWLLRLCHLVRLQSSQLGDCRDSPSIQISNPEVVMNSLLRNSLSVALLSAAAVAAPLGSSVRPAIPAEVQQLISVDYRMLKNSDTAQQLKNQVFPDQLKQFEVALRGAGIDPDRDVDQLTFVSYRSPKQGLEIVGAAQGVFATKTVLRKLKLKKVKAVKYHDSDIYPMSAGMDHVVIRGCPRSSRRS